MKAAVVPFLAFIVACVANPLLSQRQDQCSAIAEQCNAKETECRAQHVDTLCPVDVARFCPCYHVAKDCIKDAGCQ